MNGETLSNIIMMKLTNYGIYLTNLRGQGCDGAGDKGRSKVHRLSHTL